MGGGQRREGQEAERATEIDVLTRSAPGVWPRLLREI